jgi:peptidoglycan/LPS O-acetylase OafA/YrhL
VTASTALEGGPEGRTEQRFPGLDGIRALAATAVVVTHAAFWTGAYDDGAVGRALARLDVGVPIFFVLSGFLLSRPFLQAGVAGRPGPRPAAYLWRRALRILPAYWVTVVAALLLLPGNEGVGLGGWLRHLLLGQIYGGDVIAVGLSHTWSLVTEVAFYLFLPLLAAGLVRLVRRAPHRPTSALLALAVAALLSQAWLVWVWAAEIGAGSELWLPAFLGWFGGGMALALLSVAAQDWRPVRFATELGRGPGTCWALALALFWISTGPIAGPTTLAASTPVQAVTKNLLYLGVAVLVVLPFVVGDLREGRLRTILNSRPAAYLGEVSYGLFLVHVVVLAGAYAAFGWVPFTGSTTAVAIGTWVVSLAVAVAVYEVIERPLRRFRRLVPDRPGSARPGTTEASTQAAATSARA